MILDAIFDGQIYPSETVVPKCKAFWEANEAATNIMSYFEQKLSKEDYEKLERLNDRLADSQNIQNKEQFKYGFAMGVLLMKEVYEHPEFKPKEYAEFYKSRPNNFISQTKRQVFPCEVSVAFHFNNIQGGKHYENEP